MGIIISEIDLIPEVIGRCKTCGGVVRHYLCNNDLVSYRPEAFDWDWWAACEEKQCVNHYGAPYFDVMPPWETDVKNLHE